MRWPSGLLLRRIAQSGWPQSQPQAQVGSNPICRLARAGLVRGNASEPADHPEPRSTLCHRQRWRGLESLKFRRSRSRKYFRRYYGIIDQKNLLRARIVLYPELFPTRVSPLTLKWLEAIAEKSTHASAPPAAKPGDPWRLLARSLSDVSMKAFPARSRHATCLRARDDSNVRPLPQELSRIFQ